MDLKTFANICVTLPDAFQAYPVEEIRIKVHNEQIVLIHKDHRPMVYQEESWQILKPQNW